ncbi:hypothetical protein R3P38DRAFT_2762294 [Favolaschia claudopus]|uniref:Uncharacterized protein n=1 Tax=Favolaschia claudopus TaxID=2862362 RepID=A0AAW0DG29_9AGAR
MTHHFPPKFSASSILPSQCTSPAANIAIYALTIRNRRPVSGTSRFWPPGRLTPPPTRKANELSTFSVWLLLPARRRAAACMVLSIWIAFPASNLLLLPPAPRMALSIWIDVPRAGERDFPHRSQHCSVVAVVVVDAPRSGAITLTRRIVVRRATLQNYFRILKFTAILLDVDFSSSRCAGHFIDINTKPKKSKFQISRSRERGVELLDLQVKTINLVKFVKSAKLKKIFFAARLSCWCVPLFTFLIADAECSKALLLAMQDVDTDFKFEKGSLPPVVSVRIRTLETRVFRPFQGSKKSKNFPAGAG